ncbi:hypothetical protein HF673_03045 [Acidithiobacillus thiooxidans]|uniref:Uncharacterized protein n=2 Tax=Acidithiobacillus TaxID=119977 RepID=A0A5P9XS52_ACITH|nr:MULTISPECIES: hypothetical protein [Acidithiobacillus]MBU2759279.1 hypothetical protein [Acidithiobacillus sulfurivorans]MBU2834786.1 hypothetical protein [Acidithiobacillus thiooxidans]QFX96672.1 hypothetical protein GCD22_02482 [Acidithiobacillus thiooxidans ATCC 19377]
MLKKVMFGAVLSLMIVPVAAMASAEGHAVYTVKVMNNGKKISNVSISTIPGAPAPFSVTRKISYPAASKIKNGKVSLLPGFITTGVSGVLSESRKNHGVVHLKLADTRLIKMGTLVADGQTIVLPEVSTQNFQDALFLQKGQLMVLHGFNPKTGDISLTVSRAR